MSDYMFMLESHLSAEQFRVVGDMRELAGEAGVEVRAPQTVEPGTLIRFQGPV